MNIPFEVEIRPHYVYISWTGVFSSRDFLDVCDKAYSIAADKELTAILVEYKISGGQPIYYGAVQTR